MKRNSESKSPGEVGGEERRRQEEKGEGGGTEAEDTAP
jgi:hypothetical protein